MNHDKHERKHSFRFKNVDYTLYKFHINKFLLHDKDNLELMDNLKFDFQLLVKRQIYVNINMLYSLYNNFVHKFDVDIPLDEIFVLNVIQYKSDNIRRNLTECIIKNFKKIKIWNTWLW